MLTGKGKIGYLLFFCGIIALFQPILRVFSGDMNVLFGALLAIGVLLLVVGLALLQQDPLIQRTEWQIFWAVAPPPLSGKDRVALGFIIGGSMAVTIGLAGIGEGGTLAVEWPLVALGSVALAIGWFLALSEFLPSRSPEK